MSTSTTTAPPSVTEGRPRSRSFSSTPTFSSDLAKLRSACSGSSSVNSYSRAIEIASTFDVLGTHSPLIRKVSLKSEDDWIALLQKATCVRNTTGDELNIDLEKFLRYCFDAAYKMPPSPTTKTRGRQHVRSVSHGGVPVPQGASDRMNPPELSI